MKRIVKDSIGEIEIEDGNFWGGTTQRSLENFNIGPNLIPFELIFALTQIKKASAIVNQELELLAKEKSEAIQKACEEILDNKHKKQFPLKVIQTGSGTHTNMNVNEVIAYICSQNNVEVNPNDDVNMCQSSNDVFPTAINIALYKLSNEKLIPSLKKMIEMLSSLEDKFQHIFKTGRTHFMDATPMKFSDEISAWRFTLQKNIDRIVESSNHLKNIPLGGTAIGSGINCHKDFGKKVCKKLGCIESPNKFYQISTKDSVAFFHSSLNSLAISLLKISNDIRILASGPKTGFNELILPSNEPGSSIMPGKINPTQVEAMNMVCAEIFGNETTINFSTSQSILQLNTYMPLIGTKAIDSIKLLSSAIESFTVNLLEKLEVNEKVMKKNVESSLTLATALNPYIGYLRAAKISKIANENEITILQAAQKELENEFSKKELEEILNVEKIVN